MNKNRPVNLNLATIKWPITSLSSILHRISGVLLFLALPFSLWLLEKSLNSKASYAEVKTILASDSVKLAAWFVLSLLAYHIIAGVRHLLMDAGIGESLSGGTLGSRLVLLIGVIVAATLGVWLW